LLDRRDFVAEELARSVEVAELDEDFEAPAAEGPELVDTSVARIRAGQLSAGYVEHVAVADHVDAILFAYRNLQALPGFHDWVVNNSRSVMPLGPTRRSIYWEPTDTTS
jgi:hypothetical protein